MKRTSYISLLMMGALMLSGCSLFGRTSAVPAQPINKIETTSAQPAPKSHDLTDAIKGEWVITAIGSKALQTEENIPYITFVPSEGRFYGSNGCNVLNGDYLLTPAGVLSFSNVLSTMKYCADVPYEQEINQIVSEAKTLGTKFENIGNESYLYIMYDGKVALTLRRANMEYLNGKWQISEINGEMINDPEANVFFDVKEQKVHGNTGCNYFNGDIMFDSNTANSINFTGMAVTRMACHKGDQERKMLVALEEAATVVRGDNNTVLFLDRSGKNVIKLKRMDIGTEEE